MSQGIDRTRKPSMKHSSNPFMITSNQNYGIQLETLKNNCALLQHFTPNECDDNQVTENGNENGEPNLSFLYTRESDKIGAEVPVTRSALAKAFDHKEETKGQRQLVESKRANSTKKKNLSMTEIKATLDNYSHEPKSENPLYTTTSNEFGSKKPSEATLTKMRYSRSQSFSKSFNRIMFQDQGLNTSLARSNVHERLDSHFI